MLAAILLVDGATAETFYSVCNNSFRQMLAVGDGRLGQKLQRTNRAILPQDANAGGSGNRDPSLRLLLLMSS